MRRGPAASALILALSMVSTPLFAQVDRAALASKYPDIAAGSQKPENMKIICPFHRLLERAGLYDSSKSAGEQSGLTVGVLKIASIAQEFGCKAIGCGGVAAIVSAGQAVKFAAFPGLVDLEALHKATGVAHECGLTFAKGGVEVSDEVRASTLAALQKKADSEGHLRLADIEAVKEDICQAQGVENVKAGRVEVQLIYTFLGGVERGFVDYEDVNRLFHSELPNVMGSPTSVK
ncbi:MAG: hypothetical protein EOP10_11240 [Proteobacteria bacterium]|nr:MAG: hypothetical protein EOP10_11240 [Pseudomonadota bacterium]